MTEANVPPQNLEAEESVLGAMLMSANAIEAVSEILDASDFYRESHAKVYRAAVALYGKGEPVDAITLTDALEQSGELEAVGGRVRLHELAALVPASANADHYARIVREASVLRGLIRGGQEIAQLGWGRQADAPELIERAEQIVYAMRAGTSPHRQLADEVTDTIAALRHMADHPREVLGVPSGFPDLDRVTQGFEPGTLTIVAGRPSMGKTALGVCIAGHVAVARGVPTAVFSLEMSYRRIIYRFLSLMSNVEGTRIRTPWKLSVEEWQRVEEAADRLKESPLSIEDDGLLRPGTLRHRLRLLKSKQPDLGLVVVDYLQLMAADHRSDSKVQEVTEISRALKVMAVEFDVPVLALSQLSRAVEQRPDKRPILSDLRDSGAIEQDADLVLMLYRDEYYNEETTARGIVEVNVAKNRDGETSMVKLAWIGEKAKVASLHVRAA